MPDVREVQQARASATKLATLTGKAGQLIVNKDTYAVHVMDGTTTGGHAMAPRAAVIGLSELETWIVANKGTLPTE